MPRINLAPMARVSARVTAIQRRSSVNVMPPGVRQVCGRPPCPVGAVSTDPEHRRWPGARLRISCASTGSIVLGSVPAYGSIAKYSSDSPTNPAEIDGLDVRPRSLPRPHRVGRAEWASAFEGGPVPWFRLDPEAAGDAAAGRRGGRSAAEAPTPTPTAAAAIVDAIAAKIVDRRRNRLLMRHPNDTVQRGLAAQVSGGSLPGGAGKHLGGLPPGGAGQRLRRLACRRPARRRLVRRSARSHAAARRTAPAVSEAHRLTATMPRLFGLLDGSA